MNNKPFHNFFNDYQLMLIAQPIVCAIAPEDKMFFETFTRVRRLGETVNSETFFASLLSKNISAAIALDRWVIDKISTLEDCSKYSVNLFYPTILSEGFGYTLDRYNKQFIFEISENCLDMGDDRFVDACKQLSKKHQLYLDDFGVKGSNLTSLLHLGDYLTGLKLDVKLIQDIGASANQTIVGAVFRMASELDLAVVAEGVESSAIADILKELKADYAPKLKLWLQGWFYGRPKLLIFGQ